MRGAEAIKLFGLNNLLIETAIRRVEHDQEIDLGHRHDTEDRIDETYYPQFSETLRSEAGKMAQNYVIFYCLENSIRELITDRLAEQHGTGWWETVVPGEVKKRAQQNKKKEIASGFTPRSTELIDFTNFGELGEIIKTNWDTFGDMFRDVRAVEKVLASLNTLRGLRTPVEYCTT